VVNKKWDVKRLWFDHASPQALLRWSLKPVEDPAVSRRVNEEVGRNGTRRLEWLEKRVLNKKRNVLIQNNCQHLSSMKTEMLFSITSIRIFG